MTKDRSYLAILIIPYIIFFWFSAYFFENYNFNLDSLELEKYTFIEFTVNLIFGFYFALVFIVGSIVFFKQIDDNEEFIEDSPNYRFFISFTIVSIIVNVFIFPLSIYYLHPSNQFRNDLRNAVYFYEQGAWSLDVDQLQHELQCCGIEKGAKDYLESKSNQNLNGNLPLSCCKRKGIGYTCNEILAYKIGCYSIYNRKLKNLRTIIFITNTISLIIQILAAFLFNYYFDFYVLVPDKEIKNPVTTTIE